MPVICIHQPDFAPWLGFFNRLTLANIYIVLDDVQFIRRGWQHRDKIKTPRGAEWLTVPVRKKGNYHQLIRDVEIDEDNDWRRVHLATLRANYARSTFFEAYMPDLERIYGARYRYLMDLNMALISFFIEMLKVNIAIKYASDLGRNRDLRRSELLMELVHQAGGDTYLTGQGSLDYLDVGLFEAAGIRVLWQNFQHPMYKQQHGAFVPNLSSLDALLNVGPLTAELVSSQINHLPAQ